MPGTVAAGSDAPDLEGHLQTRSAAGVQVIARAAEILRALAAAPGGLSQAELAQRLGLPRTTVHRILGALEKEGFVAASRSRGRYRLGPQVARLAESLRTDLVSRIQPYLHELSVQLGETVDLSVLDHGRVTFLDQVVAPQMLRAVSAVGESFPAHCCAPGKAMLATLPDEALHSVLPPRLEALTPSTLTTPSSLRRELKRVRERGYAVDREEHTEGICAVGALVAPDERALLAISVPMPTQRFAGRERETAELLLSTCRRISADLGLTGHATSLPG